MALPYQPYSDRNNTPNLEKAKILCSAPILETGKSPSRQSRAVSIVVIFWSQFLSVRHLLWQQAATRHSRLISIVNNLRPGRFNGRYGVVRPGYSNRLVAAFSIM
jgi:hypothetical protein